MHNLGPAPVPIIGIGTDIIEIDRIRQSLQRHPEAFAKRILTPSEKSYCQSKPDPAPFVAARFAGKEAISKAMGTGIGAVMGWQDIEISHNPDMKPLAELSVLAHSRFLAKMGWDSKLQIGLHISLSHSQTHAIAYVLAFLKTPDPGFQLV